MSRKLTASQLLATTDAAVWAEQFCLIAKDLGLEGIDEGWMIGWFANAMAAQEMAMRSQTLPADFRFPESPQDTDSTETDDDLPTAEDVRGILAPEPVQPMADLSGYEFAASNGGGQVNPDFVDGPTTEEIEPIIPYFKQLSVERHYDPYFRKGVDGSLPEAD